MTLIHKAGGVLLRDRRLLVSRAAGKSTFIAPGGKVEPGETAHQALVRELNEENSIAVTEESLTFLDSFSAPAAGQEHKLVRMDVFLVSGWQGEPVPSSEIAEIRWINSTTDDIELGSIFAHDVVPLLKKLDLID